MNIWLVILVSYLLGSLSFAIIVSKFMKMDDPRSYGSGNAGATNVMRSGNKKAAALTLLGDFLKGLIVVLLVKETSSVSANIANTYAVLAAIAVILGHIYPVFFKFKGGKGVATAAGVIAGLNIFVFIAVILTWILIFKITKISSVSALLATLFAPIYTYFILGNTSILGGVTIISVIVILKHKDNIVRLISGQEHVFKKDQ